MSVLPEGRGGLSKSKVVAMTLNAFMASVDETINLRHVPNHRMDKAGVRKLVDANEKPVLSKNKQFVKASVCKCYNIKLFYCDSPAFCQ